jgi:hypothetical protein
MMAPSTRRAVLVAGVIAVEARTVEEVLRRFANITDGSVAGLLVLGDPLTISMQIPDLALGRRLPSIYQFRESVEEPAG